MCFKQLLFVFFEVQIERYETDVFYFYQIQTLVYFVWSQVLGTVKLGDKERFDKEQIGFKEPFPATNC